MYTSGSTGQPKGISICHRNVVRLVQKTNYMEFASDQNFLQLAPLAFDASTLEVWGVFAQWSEINSFPSPQSIVGRIRGGSEKHQVTTCGSLPVCFIKW